MIDGRKLLAELIELGVSVEKHIMDAEKKGEETLGFCLKNQLAMLKMLSVAYGNSQKSAGGFPAANGCRKSMRVCWRNIRVLTNGMIACLKRFRMK